MIIKEVAVTVRLRAFHPHLNIYHHQVGLLFQFILSDFLAIYEEAKPLKSFTNSPKTPQECDLFLTPISKLVGATHDTMRLFVWSRDTSLLSKFKIYCALYTQNGLTNQQKKWVLQLQQNSNQIWLYCMQCLDLLHALKKDGQNQKTGDSFNKIRAKMLICLTRISKALIPLFDAYSEDENVLFYILRSRAQLDEIFGDNFVAQMLAKMHPKGISGIETLLLDRYSKRGFNHLLPIIQAHISPLMQP